MKKTDELNLSSQVADLKLELREKELKYRDLERDSQAKERDL